jgi:hypothetical protein
VVGLAGFEPAISWVLGYHTAPKPRGQSRLLNRSLLDLASRQPLEARARAGFALALTMSLTNGETKQRQAPDGLVLAA